MKKKFRLNTQLGFLQSGKICAFFLLFLLLTGLGTIYKKNQNKNWAREVFLIVTEILFFSFHKKFSEYGRGRGENSSLPTSLRVNRQDFKNSWIKYQFNIIKRQTVLMIMRWYSVILSVSLIIKNSLYTSNGILNNYSKNKKSKWLSNNHTTTQPQKPYMYVKCELTRI